MAADWVEMKEAGTAMRCKALPKDGNGDYCGPYEGWVVGYYVMHFKRTPCPFGDEYREDDVQHFIARDGFSDWNMPRDVEVREILPETLCRCSGAIAGKAYVFEHDIVRWPGGEGTVSLDPDRGWLVLPRSMAGRPTLLSEAVAEACEVIGNEKSA